MLAACGVSPLCAQRVISIGKGSYAEFPPSHEGEGPVEMTKKREIYVDVPQDTPIPTNDWWTDLIISRYCGFLWAHPLVVSADPQGLNIFFPTQWPTGGRDMTVDHPIEIHGSGFSPKDARARQWGDWTVNFRMAETAAKYMDVTLGHGLPYVWIELKGVTPEIKFGGEPRCFDGQGRAVEFPLASDHFGMELGGRHFGVFAPDGTRFHRSGHTITVNAASGDGYLIVSPLPEKKSLSYFHRYAYAIPRDSRMQWDYRPEAAEVMTDWSLKTEALRGSQTAVIQGWIPHHYRNTTHDLPFNNIEFATPRGRMKCATGNHFRIRYPFRGFLPNLPQPHAIGGDHDYSESRMRQYIASYAEAPKFAADTYWGGKDLVRIAQYLATADELEHPAFDDLKSSLREALADWFTYAEGEKERYFARYPNWKALVGFNESYWSYQFTDHHFHYGYFTTAAALLGMYDQQFLNDYGPIARQVAKEYANWQRDDRDYPFLRTFDVWEGHSWAAGFSSPSGNNQESTSEAVQSWGGLFLLGTMLDDEEMVAAGAMGYAMETAATMEYWFDVHGDVFPSTYAHDVVGILFGGGQAYATYFSGDPAWIYGIQWLPVSPMLDYLVRDPKFARAKFQAMIADRQKKEGKTDISSMGTALGNVVLGYALQFAPDQVAAEMDKLWESGDPVARDAYTGGLTYYFAHANRAIGHVQWDYHTSIPTSAVYHNAKTGKYTFVVYNPAAQHRLATVYRNGKTVGLIHAPPRRMVSRKNLLPLVKGLQVLKTAPQDQTSAASRYVDRVAVIFSQAVEADSLQGVTIKGEGVTGLEYLEGDGTPIILFHIEGQPRAGQSYVIRVPATAKSATGNHRLSSDYVFSFKVEAQPPLAILTSRPRSGQHRVPIDLRQISLSFNGVLDLASLRNVRLTGPGVDGLKFSEVTDGRTAIFDVLGQFRRDETYTLGVPASVREIGGTQLPKSQQISFTTEPAPLPGNVYRESYAGEGHSQDGGVQVDLSNAEAPYEGRYAIRLQAPDQPGNAYFFSGTSDHGDGRRPLDLTDYSHLEFWVKGTAKEAWIKIGHPVFDKKAFHQVRLQDITSQYKRYTISIPEPKDQINTLLVVGVPAGQTLDIDNVRFVPAGAAKPR